MKMMRLIDGAGRALPCLVDAAGVPRDASAITPDFGPATLGPGLFARLRGVHPEDLPIASREGRRVGPPVARPRTIWCVGLNYSDHAREAGLHVPPEPIPHASDMTRLDWEVELGVVIGAPVLGVTPDRALAHVAGYVVVNDVSERAWQMDRAGQWVKGKSFPNFCPTGPWLVTPDEIADVQDLRLWLDVNARRMQQGSTSKMIFDVATIVAHVSQFALLEPGDLICTGTPPGVGAGMRPPVWLGPGDVVTLGIAGLGEQRQVVTPIRDMSHEQL
jgi:2,4-diketo-3-deoxy-L-fuconate hydrolase